MKTIQHIFQLNLSAKEAVWSKRILAIVMLPILVFYMTSMNFLMLGMMRASAAEPVVEVVADPAPAPKEEPKVEPAAPAPKVTAPAEEVVAPVTPKVAPIPAVVEPVAEPVVEPAPVGETQPTEGVITPEAAYTEAVVADPATEVVPEETVTVAEEVPVVTPEWQVSADGKIEKIGPVELGKNYVAPQNSEVTVTFTTLPEIPGTLSIEEITLTPEQVVSLGALSNKAYDITSNMADGTFKYDLTLPKPANQENVQIKFAENVAGLKNADTVATSDITTETDSVSASLDHFTIFVVAAVSNQVCIDAGINCFQTIQAAIDAANLDGSGPHTINVKAGTYNESQIVINKALTLQGDTTNPDSVIIDGGNATLTAAGLIRITANGNVTVKGFTIKNAGPDTSTSKTRVGVLAKSSNAGATYTISDNKIYGTNNPADNEDYGFWAYHSGQESLVFSHNTITQTGGNAVLIENNAGAVEISNNTLDEGVSGSTAVFVMNYGVNVTTLQKVTGNTINVGTGNFAKAWDGTWTSGGITFSSAIANSTGTFTNINITDNIITNLLAHRRGISLKNNSSNGTAGEISNFTITGNTVTGANAVDSIGIRLVGLVSGGNIQNNKLSNLEKGLVSTSATIDATNNWWGSAVLATVQSKVNDIAKVTVAPYYVDSSMHTLSDAAVSEVYVDDNYADGLVNDGHIFGYDAFAKIQDGISAVASGGTVNVAAGTYTEQLLIQKNLILTGAGINQTIVKAPTNGRATFSGRTRWFNLDGSATGDAGWLSDYILAAYPTNWNGTALTGTPISVKVTGFTFDANGQTYTTGAARFTGVFFGSVKGTAIGDAGLFASEVKGFPVAMGAATGIRILGDSSLTIDHNTVGYTVNGIASYGDASTATDPVVAVFYNTVNDVASVTTNDEAIVLSSGATGTIDHNTIANGNSGIGIYGAGNGIGSTISNNTLSNLTADVSAWGGGISIAENSTGNTITGNSVTSSALGILVGDGSSNNTFTDNTVTNNTTGVQVQAYEGGAGSTVPMGLVFNNNDFSGNTTKGFDNKETTSVDATNNWWGASPDFATIISGDVSHDPWYVNSEKTILSDTVTGETVTAPSGDKDLILGSDVTGDANLPDGVTYIVLDNDSGLDLHAGLVDNAVILQSGIEGADVVLTNSDLPGFSVSIPDGTLITGPVGVVWDGIIMPPTSETPSGDAPAGFSVGDTIIFVGSSQGTLTFDKAVTIVLPGVTGTVGYRPSGSTVWQEITNVCTGTYANPTGAVAPGECAISNGTDTKIVTFHFTSFGGLTDTQNPDNVKSLKAVYRPATKDVRITWNVNDDDIYEVLIYRGTSRNFGVNGNSRITKQDRKDEGYTDNNVTAGKTYYYKVVTRDEAGNNSSASVIKIVIPSGGTTAAVSTSLGTEAVPQGTVAGEQSNDEAVQGGQSAGLEQGMSSNEMVAGEQVAKESAAKKSSIWKNVWTYIIIAIVLMSGLWWLARRKRSRSGIIQ